MTHLIDWAIVLICLLLIIFSPYRSFNRLLGKYLLVPAIYAACIYQAGLQNNLVWVGLTIPIWLVFMARLAYVLWDARRRQLAHEEFVRKQSLEG